MTKQYIQALVVGFAVLLAERLSFSQVVTVTWGAQNTTGLGTADGNPAPVGSLVRVGYFDISDAMIQANQGDLNFLNTHFTQFGSGAVGDDGAVPAALPARYWNKISTGSTVSLGINTQQIYLWTFNASTLGAATQEGIFYAPKASNTAWHFPSDTDVPATTTIDLNQVTTFVVGALGPETIVSPFDSMTYPITKMAVVPEPSSYASVFGLLCLGGVLVRKKLLRLPAC